MKELDESLHYNEIHQKKIFWIFVILIDFCLSIYFLAARHGISKILTAMKESTTHPKKFRTV